MKEIQNRVHNSKFIAVMLDDTSVASNVKQSAVTICIVHSGKVNEHMLGMIDASVDKSTDALTMVMSAALESYRLKAATSREKVIGQSYNGAPTMSGELNGVQKQIQHLAASYNHITELRQLYPFAIQDPTMMENNLDVLYNSEISLPLQKLRVI